MKELPIEIITKIDNIQNKVKGIKNNSKVEFGSTKFKYPDLGTIKNIIDPLLESEKLSMITIGTEHSFSDNSLAMYVQFTDKESGKIGIQKFETLIDTKQKNAVQCVGATTTYMQRYIKKIVFDLEFTDDDPDHQKNMQPEEPKAQPEEPKAQPEEPKAQTKKPSPVARLKVFVEANHIETAEVVKTIHKVAGNNKATAKDLTEQQIENVISELDLMSRLN